MNIIKQNLIYISFLNTILKKIFFLFITLFSLSISDKFYAEVILLFLLSNYVYEIVSLSIPKIFNNYLKIYDTKKLSILAGFNLYVSLLILFFILLVFYLLNGSRINELTSLNNYFILGFLILGFSTALNDLIDKYSFLKLNHLNIYYYDILELLITVVVLFFLYFNNDTLFEKQVFLTIFIYSFVKFLFSIFKLFLFRLDIVFNVKQIYMNINFEECKNLIKLIIPIFLISVLFLLQFSISRFIVLYFEDYSSFAIFAFHIQIIELCSLFFLSLHQLSGPKISLLLKHQKKGPLLVLQNKLLTISFTIVPILFLGLYFLANDIIVLFNFNVVFDTFLFGLLSLNFLFIYLFLTMYQYMIMQNQTNFLITTLLLTFVLNLVLSLLLTHLYSLIGLAFANLLSNLFLFLVSNYYSSFFFFRKKDKKNIFFITLRIVTILIVLNIYDFTSISDDAIEILLFKCFSILLLFLISEALIVKYYRIYFILNKFIKIINYR